MSDTDTRFTPSQGVVDRAAAVLAKRNDPRLDLATAPWWVRNHYKQLAIDVFVAAGPVLLADALSHVSTNHEAYGMAPEGREHLIEPIVRATFAADMSQL